MPGFCSPSHIFTWMSICGTTRKLQCNPIMCLRGPCFLVVWNIHVSCNLLCPICGIAMHGVAMHVTATQWIRLGKYFTAQLKLDIYMCVALELFNKFVKLPASFARAHDTISWFNPRSRWVMHSWKALLASCVSYVTCKLHAWPLLNHSSTKTMWRTQYTDIARAWIISVRTIQLLHQLQPVLPSFVTTVPK